MYSNISGAGLLALIFALVISPVLSLPIRLASQSSLSFPSHNEQDLIHRGSAGRIQPLLYGPISAATEAFIDNTANGPQLVRRSSKLNAKIRAAFHKAGQKIKQGFQTAGAKIKQGFQTAGTKIKQGFQTFGQKAKQGFQKVGHFMKTTGAKIGKFGLKVVQSIGMAAGKALSWIPGVGKPIDQAIDGVSKLAGLASDKIHAKLGKKLEKGMNIMGKADHAMEYIPRRRDLSEGSEAVQQLEIDEERDEIALE
jgi:hypothetical protein